MARWTTEEVEYIKNNWGSVNYKEIAKHIGKSESAVRQYAARHNLYANMWSPEEVEVLEDYYGKKPLTWIAKRVGRTTSAVHHKAHKLGLGQQCENTHSMSIAEVARVTDADYETVRKKWVRLGLKTYRLDKHIMVRPKDLACFMEQHPDLYEARWCEEYYFRKYDWFRKKLAAEHLEERNKRWSYADKVARSS